MRAVLVLAALLLVLPGCTSLRSSKASRKEAPQAEEKSTSFADRLRAFQEIADTAQSLASGDSGDAFVTLIRAAQANHQAQPDYTPAQEYFLGRTTAAHLLSEYPPVKDQAANRYLNLLGQSLARYASDPEVWDGYRFQVVESDEINSFSTPGGFVFVTRGLLNVVTDEAQLAAVLAHEIAHIELHHGVRMIQKDRQMASVQQVFLEKRVATGRVSSEEAQEFSSSTEGLKSGLRGYSDSRASKSFESEADVEAVDILDRAGLPPQALLKMLQTLEQEVPRQKDNFRSGHLNPTQRIRDLRDDVGWKKTYTVTSAQKRRFQAALGRL